MREWATQLLMHSEIARETGNSEVGLSVTVAVGNMPVDDICNTALAVVVSHLVLTFEACFVLSLNMARWSWSTRQSR